MPSILFYAKTYFVIVNHQIVFQTKYIENAQAFLDGMKKMEGA